MPTSRPTAWTPEMRAAVRDAWTPEMRAVAAESARRQMNDRNLKAAALAARAVGVARKAVERDPTLADAIIAAVNEAREAQP